MRRDGEWSEMRWRVESGEMVSVAPKAFRKIKRYKNAEKRTLIVHQIPNDKSDRSLQKSI